MKPIHQMACALILALVLNAGCATSTVESRRTERSAAYSALSQDDRALVDQGQIRVGMSADAVYIAWGKPEEALTSETAAGRTVTWLYHGSYPEEFRYWNYRETRRGERLVMERYLDRDIDFRSYVSSEIVFEKGTVKSWRTLPRPH